MGRPERPVDPESGPVQRFAWELRRLRGEAGSPSYRQLARRAHYSATALSEAAGGERLPSLPVAQAYVRACGGDVAVWRERWQRAAADQTNGPAPCPGSMPDRGSAVPRDERPAPRNTPLRQGSRLRTLAPALTCLVVTVIITVRRRRRPNSPTFDPDNAT